MEDGDSEGGEAMRESTKCKRCAYIWLPFPEGRVIPKTGNLYFADLGICKKCGNESVRLHKATPGQQVNAQLWGERHFEIIKHPKLEMRISVRIGFGMPRDMARRLSGIAREDYSLIR